MIGCGNEATTANRECEKLAAMASHEPSPTDPDAATELLRRFAALPANGRPQARLVYRSVGNICELGFLEWLTAALGSRVYAGYREVDELGARRFRNWLLGHCEGRARHLSSSGGAPPAPAMARALAEHARAFAPRMLGEGSVAP